MAGIAPGQGPRATFRAGQALTHYFADKDEVVLEALLLVDASRQLRFETALAQDSSLVDALLAALPHDAASRRDWSVWRVFSDRASRSAALRSQYRASTGAWLDATVEALAARRGCPLQDAVLDAEIVVSTVDAIGDVASVDPRGWPMSRQHRVLGHLISLLDAS